MQVDLKFGVVSKYLGVMRFEPIVLVTSALLLISILFFPAPFHRITMIHAIHIAEGAFNQRFAKVTEFRMNYVKFDEPGSLGRIDKKVWIVGVGGKGYRDGELCGEAITVFVDPLSGHARTGAVVGFRIAPDPLAWVVVNRVTNVPSNMVVHDVTSEDLGAFTGVVKAIDRVLRETGPSTGITDVPDVEDRWREIPYSEAESFLRFFREEITKEKNAYIVYLRFTGDIYSILIHESQVVSIGTEGGKAMGN